jgi:putative ABC transport system permease protein
MTKSMKPLWRISWRTLVRHPWQTVLMVMGVTLGVAVVVAIDLANASASQAFDLSTQAVTGRSTHQITGGPNGLDEGLYARLRISGLDIESAPVVSRYLSSPDLGGRALRLLGIDPFAEAPFRDYLGAESERLVVDLTQLLTQPGSILISTATAGRYGLQIGEQIQLEIDGQSQMATISGLLAPADELSRRALDSIIMTDIATAQELAGRLGRLDQIDLIVREGNPRVLDQVEALLPPGARLLTAGARTGVVSEMSAAFRTNLTALSLLALVVGLFLIYNTMTFSVVQRRPLFGTLRSLGVTRREIFGLVIAEALIVGLLSATLGAALGVLMGRAALGLVTQTINDLFFVVTVTGIAVPTPSLLKGAALGIGATILSAAPPAWEAASVSPRAALSQSGLEEKAGRAVILAAAGGISVILTGSAVLAIPTRNLTISFLGTFAVIVGFAMLTPLAARLSMHLAIPGLGRLLGALGRMAPRDVISSLSRTSIAMAALMIAVSVIIGVSLMVTSFRFTVVAWLSQTLQGDIYLSVPSPTATQNDGVIDPSTIELLRSWRGIARIDSLRASLVDSPEGVVQIAAVDNPETAKERQFRQVWDSPEQIQQSMNQGAVLISEPFANRHNLAVDNRAITLYTDAGPRSFPVAGVYYDYTSSQGTIMMDLDVYRRLWQDEAVTALALRLDPGLAPEDIAIDIQEALAPIQQLDVRPNQVLRQEALEVFDRTFAITQALQLLATLVAFIGVLSSLLSLQLEKQRQFGILRSVGLTVRQLWGLILLETGLMGAVAGLLAMPAGLGLALILIYIINQRSFGWTLQLNLVPGPFVQAFAVAVLAALLAGIYPARKIGRMLAAEALRYE